MQILLHCKLVYSREYHFSLFFACKCSLEDGGELMEVKIDPLHKWPLNLNNNTCVSLASHSCLKAKQFSHECEAKDV